MSETLTLQEMFDRAVRGLSNQGWTRCTSDLKCVYSDGKGKHCAWGWVDQSLNKNVTGDVYELHYAGIGLANDLDYASVRFAQRLQSTHDFGALVPEKLKEQFKNLGIQYCLTWPEDVQ